MFQAKNNIIVKINDGRHPGFAILNPITGSFDLMDEKDHRSWLELADGRSTDKEFTGYMLERGYLYEDKAAHDRAVDKAYAEFNNEIANSQIQLMLVPTYGCNLACTYCYQGRGADSANAVPDHVDHRPNLITRETVDAFFDYAKANFSQTAVKPFVTLFGGEPLSKSPAQRRIIEYILDRCAQEGYEFSAVTNGYDFIEYAALLKKVKVKEIQFTLDGSREIHNSRRGAANRKGTFDRIIEGMESAVQNKFPVNLRSVVDLENIRDIVNLAEFLDAKGWLDLPPELFKTQIGRNYELFDCYAKPQHLMTQVELWGEFAALSKEYPVLAKFHRPDFKGIRHLVDTGEMYQASFDTCPACKTEWVFDLYGNIYGCTASCGREEYLLGTFWPEVRLNQEAIRTWQKRDVKSIEKCRDCKYDVICGGGCGVVGANRNEGNILAPDCRPIQELLEIGINHYINEIAGLAEAEGADASPQKMAGAEKETSQQESSCCSCSTTSTGKESESGGCCTDKKTEGCLICGKELVYASNKAFTEACSICGKTFETYAKCIDGHYVCDYCHSLDILGKVEQLLTASSEPHPVILARKLFELPGLNMHGPEYHSIVPAVLVTAAQNHTGRKDPSKIREALQRGKAVRGGNCGFYGSCGAGMGAGIAVSVLEGATPMSKKERGAANAATAHALLEISRHGGPRCCKRETVTAIETFIKTSGYFRDLPQEGYICRQSGRNKDCIGRECPYFPKKIVIKAKKP